MWRFQCEVHRNEEHSAAARSLPVDGHQPTTTWWSLTRNTKSSSSLAPTATKPSGRLIYTWCGFPGGWWWWLWSLDNSLFFLLWFRLYRIFFTFQQKRKCLFLIDFFEIIKHFSETLLHCLLVFFVNFSNKFCDFLRVFVYFLVDSFALTSLD